MNRRGPGGVVDNGANAERAFRWEERKDLRRSKRANERFASTLSPGGPPRTPRGGRASSRVRLRGGPSSRPHSSKVRSPSRATSRVVPLLRRTGGSRLLLRLTRGRDRCPSGGRGPGGRVCPAGIWDGGIAAWKGSGLPVLSAPPDEWTVLFPACACPQGSHGHETLELHGEDRPHTGGRTSGAAEETDPTRRPCHPLASGRHLPRYSGNRGIRGGLPLGERLGRLLFSLECEAGAATAALQVVRLDNYFPV